MYLVFPILINRNRLSSFGRVEAFYIFSTFLFECFYLLNYYCHWGFSIYVYDYTVPAILLVLLCLDMKVKSVVLVCLIIVVLISQIFYIENYVLMINFGLIIALIIKGVFFGVKRHDFIDIIPFFSLSIVFLNLMVTNVLSQKIINWDDSIYIVYYDFFVKLVLIANLLILNAKSSRFINP